MPRLSNVSIVSSVAIPLAAVLGVLCGLLYVQQLVFAVALIVVLPLLVQPKLLLRLIVMVAPIYWLPFVPIELYESFRDILFIGLFCSVLIGLVTKQIRLRVPNKRKSFAFLAVFLTALSGGVLFSSTPAASFVVWLKAVQAVAFFVVLFALVDTEEDIKILLVLFLIGQTISVVYFWFEVISASLRQVPPWAIPYPNLFRGDGGLSYRRTAFSNSCAHVLPVAVALVLSQGVACPSKSKVMLTVVATMIFAAIVLSHGRAGLMAAILSCAVLLWQTRKKVSVTLLMLFIFTALIRPEIVTARFMNAGPNATRWLAASEGWQTFDRWTGGRLGAYVTAVDIAVSHPLGVGLGNFEQVVIENQGHQRSFFGTPLDTSDSSSAHNLYLNVASEAGAFAFASLALFTFWYLVKAKTLTSMHGNSEVVQMISGIIIAQFVTSLFEVEIFWTLMRALPFWISLAGLTIAMNGMVNTARQASTDANKKC